ncbi:MAG: MOSC domain-containing protein [Trueperaceae bacterium]
MIHVATVKEINLYPIKSMRGVSVEQADTYWYGLNGDRKYAFIQREVMSGFPWLTGRELPRLLHYQPYFTDPSLRLKSEIRFITPTGQDMSFIAVTKDIENAYPKPISLLKLMRGTFDCMPVSIFTTKSLETFEQHFGRPLDLRRFRSNLVLETNNNESFPEHSWTNHTLVFGQRANAVRIIVNYPTKRCGVINLHPETRASNPDVVKIVYQKTNALAGVYGSLQNLGTVHVGDEVYLQ